MDGDDRYVQYKCRLKNSERDSLLRSLLLQIPFENYDESGDVQTVCHKIVIMVTASNETAYPVVAKRRKASDFCKPFISPELKAIIKQKDALKKKECKFLILYGDKYRNLRKRVGKMINRAKSLYYRNILVSSANNPKVIYPSHIYHTRCRLEMYYHTLGLELFG